MVSTLCSYTGQLISDSSDSKWKWRGRPVRLVDGTTIVMPDTPENQQIYPQLSSQKPGLGFPIWRLVGLICSRMINFRENWKGYLWQGRFSS
jgi:hypothetical protein